MKRFGRLRVAAAIVAVALVSAACGGGGGSSDGGSSGGGGTTPTPSPSGGAGTVKDGFVNGGDATGTPVTGGTLNFSETSSTLTFDLTQCLDNPANNTTLAAVYDTLMRYDAASAKFVPEMAESLTPSADFKTWTLKLRSGVKFTDGTTLDAAAVVAHLKRLAASQSATAAPLAGLITGYETPDAQTVVMTLKQAWSRFPYLLSGCGGMIPSPTAVQAEGKDYGTKPIGAGPFTVSSFTPTEKIVLVRNDGYWAGKPPLDSIVITSVLTPDSTYDRLRTGDVQMVGMQDQKVVAQALKDGTPGYMSIANLYGFQTNNGKGKQVPTFDPRVRQAIQAALDLNQFDQRVGGHIGLYGTSIFWSGSRWHTDAPTPSYDPDKAKQLVDEVKKDTGWDGSLNYLSSAQTNQDAGLLVQAMLNAVGFKVTIDSAPTTNDLISRIFVKQDFTLNLWGTTVWDSDPWAAMYVNYLSTSPRNSSGYKNPQLDQLLNQLGEASTDEQTKAVISQIQGIFTSDVPFVVTNAAPFSVFWSKNLHGVVGNQAAFVLLGKAYLSK